MVYSVKCSISFRLVERQAYYCSIHDRRSNFYCVLVCLETYSRGNRLSMDSQIYRIVYWLDHISNFYLVFTGRVNVHSKNNDLFKFSNINNIDSAFLVRVQYRVYLFVYNFY